jgi:hypothetical protein
MATLENPTSNLIQLLSSNSQHPSLNIVDTVLFHLCIADIYALHATCRSLRWLVSYMTESPSLLNINTQLGPFIKDPVRFRHQLGKHDGLLAGDFVQTFFDFGRWDVSTMLIYIERGPKSQALLNYLHDEEQYAGSDVERLTTVSRLSTLNYYDCSNELVLVSATHYLEA